MGLLPNWNLGVTTDRSLEIHSTLQARQDFHSTIKSHLAASQNKMKLYADKNRS